MKISFHRVNCHHIIKNYNFKKYFLLLLIFITSFSFSQTITTSESYTPTQLVQDVLFNTSCATISNVSVSGGNFVSGEQSFGYFNSNGTSFPFADGIILSTGKIANAQGPNSFISDDGGSMGWTGDSDLNQALGVTNTLNATVLEFDFVPLGSQISFDYIFSSEEYHGTATCQYSDGFAFLLKAVGDTNYQNLALIPNTNIPVKVTSVHPEIPSACSAQNEQYFESFNDVNHPTNFNGQTKILTAQANVIPGTTYHIKLVIADEGNYRYDSAIFLKGSSFSFGVDLGQDRKIATNDAVCPNEFVTLNATSPSATHYQWNFNGNPIIGATNSTLAFNPPYSSAQNGLYSVDVTYSATCTVTSEIVLEFAPELVINQQNYSFCDDDSIQNGIRITDLNDITSTLFTNLPTYYTVAYYENTTSSTTALPFSYQNTTPFSQVIYAKIANSSCYAAIPVTLTILTFDEIFVDETIGICDGASATLTADSGFVSYLWNTGATSESISVATQGTYTVEIENANGCKKTKSFTVVVSEIATIEDIIVTGFDTESSAEIIVSGNGDYLYSLDGINYQNSNVFTYLNSSEHTVFVYDENLCGIATKNFTTLMIPKYFTPNGDGIHEKWNLKGIKLGTNEQSMVSIFDRFGKLVKQFLLIGDGWDGTLNGTQLPADDYWFKVDLDNNQTLRGHFTLKR